MNLLDITNLLVLSAFFVAIHAAVSVDDLRVGGGNNGTGGGGGSQDTSRTTRRERCCSGCKITVCGAVFGTEWI